MTRAVLALFMCLGGLGGLSGQGRTATRTVNPHGPMRMGCESCHTASNWRPVRAQMEFDHNTQTSYKLVGGHQGVACNSCHVDRVFKKVGHECASCHADIHRRQFGGNCQECHTVKGWKSEVRQTREHFNRFPLVGAHSAAACESCHRNAAAGVFNGLSTDCAACHLKDYQAAQNPPHAASRLPLQCDQCHTMDGWSGAKFDHTAHTKFALEGAHARLECRSCHVGGQFAGTPANCFACHATQFAAAKNPDHAQAGFPRDCAVCHTTARWNGAVFDHAGQTGYALTGKHADASCSSCHVAGRFAGTPQQCEGCHLSDFQRTTNPNHAASNFSQTCGQCHSSTSAWQGAKFDHNLSKFPLTGAHSKVECAQCHVQGRYTGVARECQGCHLDAFNRAAQPNHAASGFPLDCTVCHSTVQWMGARFDHAVATKFPLTGAHAAISCGACHLGGRFSSTPSNCEGCHLSAFEKAANPDHVGAAFPRDCSACHTTIEWKGAKFDHGLTKFPLTGAHVQTQCAQCHVNGVFKGTALACEGCHINDYNKTTNPNHVAAAFPKDCQVCHVTAQWKGAKFDHGLTKFPLTGAHVQTQCAQCHVNGVFKGTALACEGCHINDYNKTTNPNHVAAAFPKDCQVCHVTAQWKGAKFDHSALTKFPLTGAHSQAQCAQCHKNNVFKGTVQTCEGCHLTAYNGTTNPNHATAGFPKDCTICHNTTQWRGAKFDHNTLTKFPLTGAHAQVQCAQCHKNNVFKGTVQTCEGCHLTAYNGTTNPSHTAAGFPKDCAVCHTTAQWKGAKFDHNTLTTFPLTGAHTTVACSSCHINGKYAGTVRTCDGCHLPAYNATTNPNHTAAGFPKDCSVCHNTTQWRGAVFDHSKTRFPLTGAHPRVQCASCHVGGRFAGTPIDCYACHQKAYETVTNPNHRAAGFPTNCTMCHTTGQWTGATFNHKFPIYSGKHAGKWTTCADCHRTPSSYAVFSCIDCHKHNKADMDSKHREQRGYVYASPSCYQCHPRGD